MGLGTVGTDEVPETTTTGDIADDENKSSPATKTLLLSRSEFYDGNDLLALSRPLCVPSHFSALGSKGILPPRKKTQ